MKAHLEEKRQELVGRREQLIGDFSEHARAADETQLHQTFQHIHLTNEFISSLDRIRGEVSVKSPSSTRKFVVSSLFLTDCFKKLTADRDEQFVFITGAEVDGTAVLDQMLELQHEKRSVGGVTADTRCSHGLLIRLERFRHRLLATFHSHPTKGVNGTTPSDIDCGFQERLERAGHRAIMAIFSRDGFIQFLRLDQNFEIEIFGEELRNMHPTFTDSPTSIHLIGEWIPGAEDRHQKIFGFDQATYSRSRILCIGAGGLISHIAPTIVRKGIGGVTLLDNDCVEVTNLNRQRFYQRDIGKNKSIALAENLLGECTAPTVLVGHAARFEDAVADGIDLDCEVVVCGVDNNPSRFVAARYFRQAAIPVIFTAVSADADHGYVFIQDKLAPVSGVSSRMLSTMSAIPVPERRPSRTYCREWELSRSTQSTRF